MKAPPLISAQSPTNPSVEHFWGWPGRGNLVYAYGFLGPWLFALFVLVYAGCDYLTGLHDYRTPLSFSLELSIPFVPATVVLYHSLHLSYSITPFVLRTRPEMKAMACVWGLITVAAAPLFLILPFEPAYPKPTEADLGLWRTLYEAADDANLRFNSCPSLHVAWSIVCIDVFAGKAKLAGRALLWLWGVGLMLSTLLLHQHHLADVMGGFSLALIGSRFVYPRMRQRFHPCA